MTPRLLYGLLILVVGLLTLYLAVRYRKRWVVLPLGFFGTMAFVLGSAVVVWAIAALSGDRSPRTIDFGSSLTYERVSFDEPQKQVLHVATVDLDNPCVSLVTTRPATSGWVSAETGTEFVARTGVALSINVSFFRGLNEYSLWSATTSGDPLSAIGPVVIDGQWLGDVDRGGKNGLALTDGQLSATVLPENADFGVRGREQLIIGGRVTAPTSQPYPRAVAGVDVDTNQLVLVVSDGKQPGYADGSTYQQVAEYMLDMGVDEALEFDGGGSSTMAATINGDVELLNRPSHQRIPGRQRPVATHMGIHIDPDCP